LRLSHSDASEGEHLLRRGSSGQSDGNCNSRLEKREGRLNGESAEPTKVRSGPGRASIRGLLKFCKDVVHAEGVARVDSGSERVQPLTECFDLGLLAQPHHRAPEIPSSAFRLGEYEPGERWCRHCWRNGSEPSGAPVSPSVLYLLVEGREDAARSIVGGVPGEWTEALLCPRGAYDRQSFPAYE